VDFLDVSFGYNQLLSEFAVFDFNTKCKLGSLSYQNESLNTRFSDKDCKNLCSNHGHCENATKLCSCETYWMGNFMKSWRNARRTNCGILIDIICNFVGLHFFNNKKPNPTLDWSVLYFVLVIFILFGLSACFLFALGFIVRKKCGIGGDCGGGALFPTVSRNRRYKTLANGAIFNGKKPGKRSKENGSIF